MRNKILGGVAAGLLTVAILASVGLGAYDVGRNDRTSAQVSETSRTVDGSGAGVVVIDRDGHRGGFFLFPLFIVGAVLLISRRRHGWGRRGYGGACGPTGSPQGFDDWHQRAHDNGRDSAPPVTDSTAAT